MKPEHEILKDVIQSLSHKFKCICNLEEEMAESYDISVQRKMRITVISDTHSMHRSIKDASTPRHEGQGFVLPGGDVLIHAGDFMNTGIYQSELNSFLDWFDSIKGYTHKIFIAGNHDVLLEEDEEAALNRIADYDSVTYLKDSFVEIEHSGKKVKIYGTPWQPEFYDWAFNLPRCGKELEEKWAQIPEDTDILITHTPPQDHLDVSGPPYNQPHLGCELLRVRLDSLKPKINVFGHIHGSYGYKYYDGSHFMNASLLNEQYKVVNEPMTFDWNIIDNSINFLNK